MSCSRDVQEGKEEEEGNCRVLLLAGFWAGFNLAACTKYALNAVYFAMQLMCVVVCLLDCLPVNISSTIFYFLFSCVQVVAQ